MTGATLWNMTTGEPCDGGDARYFQYTVIDRVYSICTHTLHGAAGGVGGGSA